MSPVADSTLHSLPLYNFRSRTVPRFLILIPVPNESSRKFNFSVGIPRRRLAKYERSPFALRRLALRKGMSLAPFTISLHLRKQMKLFEP